MATPMAMATGKLCLPKPPRALSSPHTPTFWSLYPCLGIRARGTEAGQGLSPVTSHGAKQLGQDDSGLATSHGLTPVYPDAATSHISGPKVPSTEPLQSPVSYPLPDSPPCPQLLSLSLHPLHPPLHSCGSFGNFYLLWASVLSSMKWSQ